MRYSSKIKDEEGYPAFALVNQATGQAIKHSLGESHPVSLLVQILIDFVLSCKIGIIDQMALPIYLVLGEACAV